ncbi:hypothetical protein [Haloplanus salilacus]|uniref:hypothetical protein n=1 Tax=Haloplanus salilacus TaxID=2949994 RepID=UPI0030CD795C
MDRRAALGKSFAELVMARVGEGVGVLCFLFLLPVLPFLAVAAAVSSLIRSDPDHPEPSYRPDWAS